MFFIIHRLVATLPGFVVRDMNGRGGEGSELSHLSSSLPVSAHSCWPSIVSTGVIHVHFQLLQLVMWCCHIAIGCAVGGCVLWL